MKLSQEYQNFLPESYGVADCLKEAPEAKVIELQSSLNENREENIFQEYSEYVVEMKGWPYPLDTEEAFEMFQQLTHLQQ